MRKAQHLVAISLLGACAPQSAELTSGEFLAFVAESNSQTLSQGRIDLDAFPDYFQIDCRTFPDKATGEALRLPDRVQVCGWNDNGDEDTFYVDTDGVADTELGDFLVDVLDPDDDQDGVVDSLDCDDSDPAVGECDGPGDGFWPPAAEPWMKYDGWHVISDTLEPWRGEGVVTHEGDLQVAFHQKIPGGSDFSFQFALNRFFQPTQCALDYDTGEVIRAARDGDWIDEWSKDLDRIAALQDDEEAFAPYAHMADYLEGGRLYYLNARGYQLNPDQNDDRWYMPEQWAAGAAVGKFGEELLTDTSQKYADAYLNDLFEGGGIDEGAFGSGVADFFTNYIWFCDLKAGEIAADSPCVQDLISRVSDELELSQYEMGSVLSEGDPDKTRIFDYAPTMHDNLWRPVDGLAAGFDGWVERYESYVVFSEDSDLRIGGSARGAFTVVLVGQDSNTRTVLKGEFDIPKLKADKWGSYDLREEKRDEAGIEYCAF